VSLYWLTFSAGGQLAGAFILKASDALQARFYASIEGLHATAKCVEWRELDSELAALIPTNMVGHMLSSKQAQTLIRRLERSIPKRPPAPSVTAALRRLRRIAR